MNFESATQWPFSWCRSLRPARLPRPSVEVDALLPYERGDLVSRIHEKGEVLHLDHTAEGTRVRARVNPSLAGELDEYAVAPA